MDTTGQDLSTQALFQQEWQIYQTALDHNYFCHREVAGRLRRIVTEEVVQPFRFLDIACGDASPAVAALTGTRIASYHGIDLSAAALALARPALAQLECPVSLRHAEFVEALTTWEDPVDIVWIGLSLHHLRSEGKLGVLRAVRNVLAEGGLFVMYDVTSPDGEERAGWLARWDAMLPTWTAFTAEGWASLRAHVHAADFPETPSGWHTLGAEAGFSQVREVYAMPADLFRMYVFAS